jgi:hypothetical protein
MRRQRCILGTNALEIAKVCWNAVVMQTGNEAIMTKTAREYLEQAQKILEVYGNEGDEAGPLLELRALRTVFYEEP